MHNTSTVREILRKSVDFSLIDEANVEEFLDLAFQVDELKLGIYLSRHFCLEEYLLLFASALVDEKVFFEIYVENFSFTSRNSLFDAFYPSSRETLLWGLGGNQTPGPTPKIALLEEPTYRTSNEIFIHYPDGIASKTELSNSHKREVMADPFPLAKFVQIFVR